MYSCSFCSHKIYKLLCNLRHKTEEGNKFVGYLETLPSHGGQPAAFNPLALLLLHQKLFLK